jgi:uncharacterized protein (TIGR02246 family)
MESLIVVDSLFNSTKGGMKMKKQIIYGVLLCITLAFFLCVTPSTNAATAEDEVLQVMTNWFNAYNTNNADLMASLYWNSPKFTAFCPDPSSAFLIQGWELNAAGWKPIAKAPIGTYVNTPSHIQVTMLTDNVAIITGYNTETDTNPTTKVQSTYHIRGTFVVQKIGGKWLIVHEHSSVFPVK